MPKITPKKTEANIETGVVSIAPKDQKDALAIGTLMTNVSVAPTDVFGKMTRSQIDLIKRTIAKGSSDDELNMFLQTCKGASLNPFLRQVFLVPRWDNKSGKEVRAIQVSIDGLRSIAESSGAYAGNDDPVFVGETELKSVKVMAPNQATVTVYKVIGGNRYPFTATARWNEYYPGEKSGKQWHTRPYLMLGKCAEALALRKAFPKLLSGMYEQAELRNDQPQATENQRIETGLNALKKAVGKASVPMLNEYLEKMQSSPKYSEDQKKEFAEIVDVRLKELEKNGPAGTP